MVFYLINITLYAISFKKCTSNICSTQKIQLCALLNFLFPRVSHYSLNFYLSFLKEFFKTLLWCTTGKHGGFVKTINVLPLCGLLSGMHVRSTGPFNSFQLSWPLIWPFFLKWVGKAFTPEKNRQSCLIS